MARTYIISEICGDWSLHIKGPGTSNNFLFFKSRNNAELVKSILEWEDAHPNKAVPYKPTLTPPNEWLRRVKELDELYTKLQIVTGFTAEQLLEMFTAGYTLEKPDYSKHFEAMANLAESDPSNEPLTLDELRQMDGEPVYVVFRPDISEEKPQFWVLVSVDEWNDIYLANKEGWVFNYEKFLGDVEGIYRRPPEGEEDI